MNNLLLFLDLLVCLVICNAATPEKLKKYFWTGSFVCYLIMNLFVLLCTYLEAGVLFQRYALARICGQAIGIAVAGMLLGYVVGNIFFRQKFKS